MRVLVCIDDTDNIDSKGTGALATMLAQTIEERGWGKSSGITRHQLLVHPDIPYTSHNSSMCFQAEIDGGYLDTLINYASEFLALESAEGSDPGLCVALPDQISKPELLIAFGHQAKETVVTKQHAYSLAKELGIHLSEHGGTGQGVIGALAGAGLRLSGNDGRFKGKIKIKTEHDVITVKDICARANIDLVKSLEGTILGAEDLIRLGETVKTVLLEGKAVLLVFPTGKKEPGEPLWQTCTKQQLKAF